MTGWTRQRICSYSIRRFLLIKHYICSRVWVSKTSFFFFLTWHCDRRIRLPRYQTWQWDRLFTFSSLIFLALNQKNVFLSFFRKRKKTGRRRKEEELEGVKATELNTKRRWIKECTQKKMRDDTKGSTVAPFITAFISFLSLRGEATECVYVHCSY